MLKIVSGACAALMMFAFPLSAPAVAMPAAPAVPIWDAPTVIPVQRGEQFRWRHGRPYYRGHRGYRHHRPGYRRHGNYWFPPAAFIAGAIIGGALSNQAPPPRYRGSNAHVEWCYARYRSYRERDNTFQPYNGPRRQCVSPYG